MTHPPDAGSNGPPAPFHEVRIGRDDPAEIRRSYDENGYLFFKGALNADTVLRAKEDIAGVLQQQSYMQKGSAEPRATPGASAVEVDYGPLYRLKSPWELMASPELQEAVDIAYGEKVRLGRSIGFRYSMPTDAPYLTPPHQDHFYIRETDEFRMIWIPLMDMEIANGGLAIAADSHKHGLQEHVEFDGVYSYSLQGTAAKGSASRSHPRHLDLVAVRSGRSPHVPQLRGPSSAPQHQRPGQTLAQHHHLPGAKADDVAGRENRAGTGSLPRAH